jgi:hypothetical protein
MTSSRPSAIMPTVYSDSSDTIAQFYDYQVETGKTDGDGARARP